jgi:SWI/SNF-related matrix-associated actin-dependent regulator 1 of chromatin subfamily A
MLYQHQAQAATVLADPSDSRRYLGDEPGLGKTRTLLAALERTEARRPLVVTPAIVRTHWVRERDSIDGRRVNPIIQSYDQIVRGGFALMKDLLDPAKGAVDSLVVDEAHYCKHITSQRSQIIFGANGYARRLPLVLPASGTPMPRNPLEYWPVMAGCFREIAVQFGLKTVEQWKERFCVVRHVRARGQEREKIVDVKNVEELKQILELTMIRRTLEDVGLDVPQIDFQVLRLDTAEKPEIDIDLRHRVEDYITLEELEMIALDPQVARMRRRLGELKVAPVAEMITSQLADSAEKLVVFAHHRSVLTALRELLKSFGVAYIDGDVAGPARDREIERFQTDPKCRVFLGQNIACSTGMDGLQHVAHRAISVEPDWARDVNLQLGKRIARIGSTSRGRCIVQMIALAGTLDEAIVAQNAREVRMVNQVNL